MQRIDAATAALPLYRVASTRVIEQTAQAQLPPHTLMQRAGLAVARLALASAPHAQRLWIACGPGNNGGDGLEAAAWLQAWGKAPTVTWLGNPTSASADTQASLTRALAAGVVLADDPPANPDFCIDALLGIGARPAPQGRLAEQLHQLQAARGTVLCVDLPSGLDGDSGAMAAGWTACAANRRITLSLLSLKPGLFSGAGRDAVGALWFDDLGVTPDPQLNPPDARLIAPSAAPPPVHASHKGTRGDVVVLGGATGMAGAALLAGSAALHGGAGRVYLALLNGGGLAVDPLQPELMLRSPDAIDWRHTPLVCGCGGGDAVTAWLPKALATEAPLVLDADALNAVASTPVLRQALRARGQAGSCTVLTPHPLEAARLLGQTTAAVQANRLAAAQRLADELGSVMVLKGAGSVVAAPGRVPLLNASGNGRLATAGTGDVLAGWLGAALAALPASAGMDDWQRHTAEVVWAHGALADQWLAGQALTAQRLARAITALA